MFYRAGMAPEPLFEIARRRFDTPEFRGMEFIEAECKTIINHVPGNYLPFNWSINPYRGCSHACSYCAWGDTPLLLADGRVKPLAKIEVGEIVYGTERQGRYRRYVPTPVLAYWETHKPAYRVTLEDGTELITSGDHRFLTALGGWKHVAPAERGAGQRPFLTTNNKLLGVGGFADSPIDDEDYRRGYLTGMIRGDGHVGSYRYRDPARRGSQVQTFRLALVDGEGLDRTAIYLSTLGIRTRRFLFSAETPTRKEVHAIANGRRDDVERIRELIRWPTRATVSWRKGFLAGIFDAEGTCARDVIRIATTDDAIIMQVIDCLRTLQFSFVLEDLQLENGLRNVRVPGGLRERMAFLHTVDPAITRKRTIDGLAVKSNAPLRVVGIESLGVELPMFDITTGTGDFISDGVISHNCFARPTHTFLDMNAGSDFEKKIVVKINAPEVLRRQLAAKRWKGEGIAMGTNTDPYQRAEGRYRLMPGIIRALTDYRNPFSILTKGTLILRDLELLVGAARVTEVSTAFSIGTLDEAAWRASEPGTPHPRKRIEAVRALNEAGIPCGVLMAPILPGITDDPRQLREVVAAAIDAGATHVSPILLHLRPGVREEFLPWLAETHPDLVERYEELYRRPYAPATERDALGRHVSGLIRSLGGVRPAPAPPSRFSGRARGDRGAAQGEQLTLV
jgi:DNA repair photolyase